MRGQRGAALLVVVLLVALLAVLVVEFQREARLEMRTAGNLRDALEAHALVRSGVAVGSALLLADAEDNDTDHRGELWAGELPPVPLGSGILAVRVEDLAGRFPLGALLDAKGVAIPARTEAFRRLLDALQLEDADEAALVDALVDWIDADENGDFETNPDVTIPNSPIEHLEQLERIEGFNARILARLLPHLDTRSETKLNVNTATPEVLTALHPDLTMDRAEELYQDLGDEPLDKPAGFKQRGAVRDLRGAFALEIAVDSNRFRLHLVSDVRGVNRVAVAVLERDPKEKTVRTTDWHEE